MNFLDTKVQPIFLISKKTLFFLESLTINYCSGFVGFVLGFGQLLAIAYLFYYCAHVREKPAHINY